MLSQNVCVFGSLPIHPIEVVFLSIRISVFSFHLQIITWFLSKQHIFIKGFNRN
jgi:hypothetical protein